MSAREPAFEVIRKASDVPQVRTLTPPKTSAESSPPPSKEGDPFSKLTPFGVNRYFLLCLITFYTFCIGSHYFNWTPWEELLKRTGAFEWRCRAGESLPCKEQETAIAEILPLTSVTMFTFTLVAGLILDIVGPKACCVIGNVLLLSGWALLSFASESFNTYFLGFALMGAGTDPAFFGTLNLANLFPGYGSTVIAILGGSRSLTNIFPVIMEQANKENPSFDFRRVCLSYFAIYVICLFIAIFFVPKRPYKLPKTLLQNTDVSKSLSPSQQAPETLGNSREAFVVDVPHSSWEAEVMRPMSSESTSGGLARKRTIPAASAAGETSSQQKTDVDASVVMRPSPASPSDMRTSTDEAAAPPPGPVTQLISLMRWLKSPLYFPVVLLMIANMIRNNYFLTSASKQLGSAASFLTLMNILAFIPGPISGFLVDLVGPIPVLYGLNTTNFITYILLLLGQLSTEGSLWTSILLYGSVVFSFPGIGFLLSQVYCYITLTFPPEDMGKLSGLASCTAGIVALTVTPMYRWSLYRDSFWEMDVFCIGLSIAAYFCILTLLISCRKREKKQQLQLQAAGSSEEELVKVEDYNDRPLEFARVSALDDKLGIHSRTVPSTSVPTPQVHSSSTVVKK